MKNRSGRLGRMRVIADGEGVVSHAGVPRSLAAPQGLQPVVRSPHACTRRKLRRDASADRGQGLGQGEGAGVEGVADDGALDAAQPGDGAQVVQR